MSNQSRQAPSTKLGTISLGRTGPHKKQIYEAPHGPGLKFGHIRSADQDLHGPTGGHLPPRLLALSLLSLGFRRHLSLPLGAFQFDAGNALLRRLAATYVGGDQILAEAVALLADAPVASFPSLGNHQSTTASPTTGTPPPGPARGSGPCPGFAPSTSVSLPPYARSSPGTSSHRDFLGPPLPPAGLHIRGQNIGNPEMHFSRDELIGSAFIAFGITLFVCFFYVAIVSKLLRPYENQFLAAIQEDWYYCLLVPLTLPVIIVAVYLHWLSMKMFKHA